MSDSLKLKIQDEARTRDIFELALGYLRYEALRKLNLFQFVEFWNKCIHSERTFDSRVDDLIEKDVNPGPK